MQRGEPQSGGAGYGVPTWAWHAGRRLPIMLAGGALAIAGLVACSSAEADPEPEPTTPTVPETTETDSAGLDEETTGEETPGPQDYEHPVPGTDIDDDGQAGAEAAAVYFVELYSYVHATGSLEAWDELTSGNCSFCGDVRESVLEIYGDGGFIVTSPPTITEVASQVWPGEDGDFAVAVGTENSGFRDYDAQGELIMEYPAESVRMWVHLEYADGDWLVLGSEVEEAE